jgi:hypothetical protein
MSTPSPAGFDLPEQARIFRQSSGECGEERRKHKIRLQNGK